MVVSSRHQYRTRPPAVAGAFYPGTPAALDDMVAALLAAARGWAQSGLRGVIAPHAGYVYSGPTAAEAFAAARDSRGAVRRVVLVGPSHFVPFRGLAAPQWDIFRTPLGDMPVDVAAVEELERAGLAHRDDLPHAREHALEVELPFLQRILGDVAIVPVLFGTASASDVAAAIGRLWDHETLLVISSDLSHYEPYGRACAHDLWTAEAIEALDQAAIGPSDACGHLAIRGALIEAACQALAVKRLDLRNSGDTAGDRHQVVGYGAWAFVG